MTQPTNNGTVFTSVRAITRYKSGLIYAWGRQDANKADRKVDAVDFAEYYATFEDDLASLAHVWTAFTTKAKAPTWPVDPNSPAGISRSEMVERSHA